MDKRDQMVIAILNNHCVACDCSKEQNPFISLGLHCEGNFEGASHVRQDICHHPMARVAYHTLTDFVLKTSNIVGDTAFKVDLNDENKVAAETELEYVDTNAPFAHTASMPKTDPGLEADRLIKDVKVMVAIADLLHDTKQVPWYKSAKFNNELAAVIGQVREVFNTKTWPIIEFADQVKKDHLPSDARITFTPKLSDVEEPFKP